LIFETALSADSHAELNSPGSKGRIGGGYGGFFWRFPACDNVEVFTSAARGEDEVHGSVAPWVAWSADFAAGPGVSGRPPIVIRRRTRPRLGIPGSYESAAIRASGRRWPGIVPSCSRLVKSFDVASMWRSRMAD
jgi:hypothetical protein